MSFELCITRAAWADAESIYEWIRDQKQAPLNAHRWFNSWMRHVRNLEMFPDGRSLAPENGEFPGVEIHHQLFSEFRSLYVVRDRRVFIIHVRRGSRKTATQEELRVGMQEALQDEGDDP